MLSTKNLIKQYSNRKVVDNVSVHIKKGEIVGLLGPNGAGKTTTFYMITGMIKPSKGHVFLDKNWRSFSQHLGKPSQALQK